MEGWIARLAAIHHETPALQTGAYEEVHVASEQLAFLRRGEDQVALIAVNSAQQPVSLNMPVLLADGMTLTDALDPAATFTVQNGMLDLGKVPAEMSRILIGLTVAD